MSLVYTEEILYSLNIKFLSYLQAQAQEVRWEREQLEMKRTEPSTIIDAAHKTKSVSHGTNFTRCHINR